LYLKFNQSVLYILQTCIFFFNIGYYSLQGQVTLHLELKKKKKRCKQYIHVT